MLQEGEIKFMNPPVQKKNEKIKSSSYLIHRELMDYEDTFYESEGDIIFKYEGRNYLYSIATSETEKQAIDLVKSYWKAIQQINKKKQDKELLKHISNSFFFI